MVTNILFFSIRYRVSEMGYEEQEFEYAEYLGKGEDYWLSHIVGGKSITEAGMRTLLSTDQVFSN